MNSTVYYCLDRKLNKTRYKVVRNEFTVLFSIGLGILHLIYVSQIEDHIRISKMKGMSDRYISY